MQRWHLSIKGVSRPQVGKNSPPARTAGDCPAMPPGAVVSCFDRPARPLDDVGQVNRLEFGWTLFMMLLGAFIVLSCLFQNESPASLLAVFVGIALLNAAYVRPRQGRNIGGWWSVLFPAAAPLLIAAPVIDVLYYLDWSNLPDMFPEDGTALAAPFPATAIVPIMAAIVIVFLVLPSQPGPNTYGPNPHEVPQ